MPIRTPSYIPSKAQLEKAKRSLVFQRSPARWEVWDPKIDSTHFVTPSYVCDCTGFRFHGYCAHIVAVELFLKIRHMSCPQAVQELYGICP